MTRPSGPKGAAHRKTTHSPMRKLILLTLLALFPFGAALPGADPDEAAHDREAVRIYTESGLAEHVAYSIFEKAYAGYEQIDGRKKEILTLIDFSKPSTEERLFVIDIRHARLLYHSRVAHGKNSGGNYATSFGNTPGSYKSSLGFYLTENTYMGKNGYSLILNGLEQGINDKAKERAIVMHGADYCDPSFVQANGRLGRSFGCPALPRQINRQVINTIKEGSVLYIYAPDPDYLAMSSFTNRETDRS